MRHRTETGQPISGSISGFGVISIQPTLKDREQIRIETDSPVPPIISPADVISAISKLQELFNEDQFEQAVALLYSHIDNTNNPHGTTLDQFTQTVVDIFYDEYINNGGTVSKEIYARNLFETPRIVSSNEIMITTDKNALMSVVGARKFIDEHEQDNNAHAELFDRLIPGVPPTTSPSLALISSVGLPPYGIAYGDAEQTYVGKDRMIHIASPGEYPADYCWGDASFPIFKETKNLIRDNNSFNQGTFWNITSIEDADIDPMGTDTAVAIFSESDTEPCQHKVTIPNISLPKEKPHSFSVYVKKESCRYFSISFKDMHSSDIVVYGIYDLIYGTCSIFNGLTRYGAQIQKLANGWYRCILNMYHTIGQVAEIDMTFFKEKSSDYDMNFMADEELLGYLWGMQYEANRTASPFIIDSDVTRPALNISLDLSDTIWNKRNHTVTIAWMDVPMNHSSKSKHPILATVNSDGRLSMVANQLKDRTIKIIHYADTESDEGPIAIETATTVVKSDAVLDTHKFTYSFEYGKEILIGVDSTLTTNTAPQSYNEEKKLLIGYSPTDSFDGYIRNLAIYPVPVTHDNIRFIHGEVIYG